VSNEAGGGQGRDQQSEGHPADEPTAALDSVRGRQVMELFRRVAHERNAGVIVVTHDDRILTGFDRVYRMLDGRIASSARTSQPSGDERYQVAHD
jgi:ABC-type lipoprotein export system ATPase subunit